VPERLPQLAAFTLSATGRFSVFGDTFVKDQAFVLPLANYAAVYATRSNTGGITRQPVANYPSFEDIWLA
jgi:hypothetical protein